jgi:hypothetical protein
MKPRIENQKEIGVENMDKTEASVLCDVHHTQMERVGQPLQFSAQEVWIVERRKCAQANCNRQFSPDHGYFEYRDGILDPETRMIASCPSGHAMVIAAVDECGKPEWRCIVCAEKEKKIWSASAMD